MADDDLLTPKETGSLLRCSERTVRRMCRGGVFGHKLPGSQWRILRGDAEKVKRGEETGPARERAERDRE